MSNYWYCPVCKGNYDNGEQCDCQQNEEDEFYENEAEKDHYTELQRV